MVGAAVAPSSEVANAIATTAGKLAAQKGSTTVQLPGGESAKPKGDEAGTAAPATAAGPPAAAHFAKADGAEPASPLAPQEAAQQPDSKVSEVLQPLQSLIDLSASAQVRPTRPDAALAVMTPEQAAAQAANAQAQAATGGQPTPLHVVPIEIGLRALAGGRKFDIRLDPAELGRVDVSLNISDSGEVTAKLVVDRVETLHMLQRDARTLERAFEQAGLKPSNAGVDIILRDPGDQSSFRQNRQQDDAPRRTRVVTDSGEDIGIAAQPVQSTSVRGLIRLGGVDLSI
jgi:flagellar hook-length control protein FliK